jgi:hypothetical protein
MTGKPEGDHAGMLKVGQVPSGRQLVNGLCNFREVAIHLFDQRAKQRRRFEPVRLATILAPLFMTT